MSQPPYPQPVPVPGVVEEVADATDSPDSADSPDSPDSPGSPSTPSEPDIYEPTIIDVPPEDPALRPEGS